MSRKNMFKITILVDNLDGSVKGFTKSYGFSALIEIDNKKILFDTGSNKKPLLHNLKALGYSPKDLECVILSHNHDDHTDGLPGILQENKMIPVYVHKDWDRKVSFMGFQVPEKNKRIVNQGGELSEISNNIILTDPHHSNDYGGIDEHACYLKNVEKGSYILITGCCHPGLINFLNEREKLKISNNSMISIIGGLHGFRFSNKEAEILYPKLEKIILFHCTTHVKTFERQFKEKASMGVVGKTYLF
jgi:7,8-dihydropterin-6-yl-methyl-4-(beta-D-ribofuranosyl)aminobenzene 5'-phosphate synthase